MRFWRQSFILNYLYQEYIIYRVSYNLSYAWNFGVMAFAFLVLQVITGVFLAMYYDSNIQHAFYSLEHIMRDVNYGWMIRYLHANGASFFF